MVFCGIDVILDQVDKIFQRIFLVDKPKVDAVFKINDGVANIIGCLNKKCKRMSHISNILPGAHRYKSQFFSDLFKYFYLCLENPKFFVSYIPGGFMRKGFLGIFNKCS